MNTITNSKDNVGSTVLLAALLITTLTAIFSAATAEAKGAEVAVQPTPVVETIVVTATRLK
jgi:hypothetical protein